MDRRPLDILRRPGVAPVALAVLAFFVGCAELGRTSLWVDEALSVDLATRPFDEFVEKLVTSEANQSLYFVLLRLWPLHGAGEVGPRLLSVLFTAATVPLLYELGRKLYDRETGAAAAVLVAVLPFALQATQEARGYSLLMLVATGSAYALVVADEGRPRGFALYGLCSGLLAYTHVYGLFIVLGQLAWAAFAVRDRAGLLRGIGIAGIVAAPMAVYIVLHGSANLWYLTTPGSRDASLAVQEFGAGSTLVGTALLLAGLGGALIGLVHRPRPTALLLAWLGMGAAVPIAYSLFVSQIFQERYLAGLVPAFALLVAAALREVPTPRARAVAVVAVAVGLLLIMPGHYGPLVREDWRGAVAYLDRGLKPGDQVLASPTFEAVALNAYRADRFPAVDPDRPTAPVAGRVWVIGRANPPELAGYQRQRSEEIGLIHITLFAASTPLAESR